MYNEIKMYDEPIVKLIFKLQMFRVQPADGAGAPEQHHTSPYENQKKQQPLSLSLSLCVSAVFVQQVQFYRHKVSFYYIIT